MENQEQVFTPSSSPYANDSWTETAPQDAVAQEERKEEVKAEEEKPTAEAAQTTEIKEEVKLTATEEKKEEAQTQIQTESKQEQKEELRFANEYSKKLFDYLKEGKENDVLNFLKQKEQLSKIESLDLSQPSNAAEVVKLNILYKNPSLTSEDVDFLFEQEYAKPSKPQQGDDQTDEEYQQDLAKWQSAVQSVERKLTIQAKMVQPEVLKHKEDLVLPDLPNQSSNDTAAAAEVQQKIDKLRESYVAKLSSDYSKFDGFSVTYKNGEVDVQIPFTITSEEKEGLKTALESFDHEEYFTNRWFNGEGEPKVQDMMMDKYFLENRDMILRKVATDASSKAVQDYINQQKNISVNTTSSSNNNFEPNPKEQQGEMAKHFFSN